MGKKKRTVKNPTTLPSIPKNQKTADKFLKQNGGKPANFTGFTIWEKNLKGDKLLTTTDGNGQVRTTESKYRFHYYHAFVGSVAFFGSRNLFEEIPTSQVEIVIKVMIDFLRHKATQPSWKTTGYLETHERGVLFALGGLARHKNAVKVFLSERYLEDIAAFVAALPLTIIPHLETAEELSQVFYNTHATLFYRMEWEYHKVLKKLETTGMLCQFLRFSIVTVSPSFQEGLLGVYKRLHTDLRTKKKFKRGKPCGETAISVLEVLSQKPGINSNREVVNCLRAMVKEAEVRCRYCCCDEEILIRVGKTLRKCSHCKVTLYCSEKCQRNDWKRHKAECKPKMKTAVEPLEIFFRKNNKLIVGEVFNMLCNSTENIYPANIFYELDFSAENEAPALQDPPKYKIHVAAANNVNVLASKTDPNEKKDNDIAPIETMLRSTGGRTVINFVAKSSVFGVRMTPLAIGSMLLMFKNTYPDKFEETEKRIPEHLKYLWIAKDDVEENGKHLIMYTKAKGKDPVVQCTPRENGMHVAFGDGLPGPPTNKAE